VHEGIRAAKLMEEHYGTQQYKKCIKKAQEVEASNWDLILSRGAISFSAFPMEFSIIP
jgi:hypothetical protein